MEEWVAVTLVSFIVILCQEGNGGLIIWLSHHIWLRDHCRCPECLHPVTKQRLVNTFEVSISRSHFERNGLM